jgi:hypothetical protein
MTRLYFKASFLLFLAASVKFAYPYSINVEAGEYECFIVTASRGITCTGSFEVITPDPTPIVVTVKGPAPKKSLHFESKGKSEETSLKDLSEGSFSFEADSDGDHTMCIYNGKKDENDGITRLVAFNFRAATSSDTKDYQYAGLESELAELRQGLDMLRDHQSYMNQREDVHKLTLESINTKVLCWTVLEAFILVGMAFWQISYISSFFETKRRL